MGFLVATDENNNANTVIENKLTTSIQSWGREMQARRIKRFGIVMQVVGISVLQMKGVKDNRSTVTFGLLIHWDNSKLC